MASPARKSLRIPANLSIDGALLSEAKSLDVNVSRAAEAGIAKAVSDEKARRWMEENEEALKSSNGYVETHGLPLGKHRLF